MSSAVAHLIVGPVSLLALAATMRVAASSLKNAEWNTGTTLVFSTGMAINGPLVLASIMGAKQMHTDAYGTPVASLPSWFDFSQRYAQRALVAVAVVAILRRLGNGHKLQAPALALAALCLLAAISDWINGNTGHEGYAVSTTSTACLVLLLLAAAFTTGGKSACFGAALVGLLLAAVSGVLSLFEFANTFVPCSVKCGLLGYNFVGALDHENVLGLALAMSIPFVWVSLSRRLRPWLVTYLALLTFVTGSRTSEVAAVATVIVLALARPRFDASGQLRCRHPQLAMGAALTVVVSGILAPIIVPLTGYSLTGRPALWNTALTMLANRPWEGLGARTWPALVTQGVIPPAAGYSVHNQWLDIAFDAGLLGIAVALAVAVSFMRTAGGREQRGAICLVVLPMLVAGIAERPWSIAAVDWLSFAMLAAVLTLALPTPQIEPRDYADTPLTIDRGEYSGVAQTFSQAPSAQRHLTVKQDGAKARRQAPSASTLSPVGGHRAPGSR